MAGVDDETRELVSRALAEDLGRPTRDVTAEATVPEGSRARARIVQKAPGTLFGLDVAAEVFRQTGATDFDKLMVEGQWRDAVPAEVALVSGPARAVLAGERTALNFLGRLSGVATMTAGFAEAVRGTGARILDTRKTTPGLRRLEKAAVAAGGGANHRMGLFDAILVKENNVAMAGGVREAVAACRAHRPDLMLEIECRDLDEVRAALEAGADRILLDNMAPEAMERAVALRDELGAATDFEASGGIDLGTVRRAAETGVEYVSVGALTHSAPALDLSLLIEPA